MFNFGPFFLPPNKKLHKVPAPSRYSTYCTDPNFTKLGSYKFSHFNFAEEKNSYPDLNFYKVYPDPPQLY